MKFHVADKNKMLKNFDWEPVDVFWIHFWRFYIFGVFVDDSCFLNVLLLRTFTPVFSETMIFLRFSKFLMTLKISCIVIKIKRPELLTESPQTAFGFTFGGYILLIFLELISDFFQFFVFRTCKIEFVSAMIYSRFCDF